MKRLTPQFKSRLHNWTRPQVKSLLRLMSRFNSITPDDLHQCEEYTGVTAGGMFIGIEQDGYTHT